MPTSNSQWSLTRSPELVPLGFYGDLPEATPQDVSSYSFVGWDQIKVHQVGQQRLYTEELGPCFVLCARGLDENRQITHFGMAHWFGNTDCPKTFLQKMRNQVGESNPIELFIGGGENDAKGRARQLSILVTASQLKIDVVHDVSLRYFNDIGVSVEGGQHIYRGSTGISQVWLDEQAQPHLHVSGRTAGKTLAELIQESTTLGKPLRPIMLSE